MIHEIFRKFAMKPILLYIPRCPNICSVWPYENAR